MGQRYIAETVPPRPWEETLELARRINVPALRHVDGEVVDEYWPPRFVDGHLQGRRVA